MGTGGDTGACHPIGSYDPNQQGAYCDYYLGFEDYAMNCADHVTVQTPFEARSFAVNYTNTPEGTTCWIFSEWDCNGDWDVFSTYNEPSPGAATVIQISNGTCYPSVNPWRRDNFKSFRGVPP